MKKIRTPTAVTSAVLTMVTIFFWVGFEVYRGLTVKPPPPVPVEIIKPLEPTLDTSLLDKLNQRLIVPDSDIDNVKPTQTLLPVFSTSTPSGTPTSTGSATL